MRARGGRGPVRAPAHRGPNQARAVSAPGSAPPTRPRCARGRSGGSRPSGACSTAASRPPSRRPTLCRLGLALSPAPRAVRRLHLVARDAEQGEGSRSGDRVSERREARTRRLAVCGLRPALPPGAPEQRNHASSGRRRDGRRAGALGSRSRALSALVAGFVAPTGRKCRGPSTCAAFQAAEATQNGRPCGLDDNPRDGHVTSGPKFFVPGPFSSPYVLRVAFPAVGGQRRGHHQTNASFSSVSEEGPPPTPLTRHLLSSSDATPPRRHHAAATVGAPSSLVLRRACGCAGARECR